MSTLDMPLYRFSNGNLIITRFICAVRKGPWCVHHGLGPHAGRLTLAHESSIAVMHGLSICDAAHALRQIQILRPCPATTYSLVMTRTCQITVPPDLQSWIDECFAVVTGIQTRINKRYDAFDWRI